MPSVADIAGVFAGWNSLYSNSKVVATAVTTVHLLGLLVAGGLAIAADRMTLRVSRADAPRIAHEIRDAHRPVLIALALVFVSGIGLATADVETFLVSPFFWVKLGLVALLLLNGLGLARTESRVREGQELAPATWGRLRFHAWASLALWVATTIAGTVLVNAA